MFYDLWITVVWVVCVGQNLQFCLNYQHAPSNNWWWYQRFDPIRSTVISFWSSSSSYRSRSTVSSFLPNSSRKYKYPRKWIRPWPKTRNMVVPNAADTVVLSALLQDNVCSSCLFLNHLPPLVLFYFFFSHPVIVFFFFFFFFVLYPFYYWNKIQYFDFRNWDFVGLLHTKLVCWWRYRRLLWHHS